MGLVLAFVLLVLAVGWIVAATRSPRSPLDDGSAASTWARLPRPDWWFRGGG